MAQPATFTSLFTRAQNGDGQALGELLESYRTMLCDRARLLLPPELLPKVSASDIFQETCIEAMRDFSRTKMDNLAAMEAWLVRALTNNVLDWRRRFKRSRKRDVRKERPLKDFGSNAHLLYSAKRDDPSPEELAIAKESQESLDETLLKLKRGYREIIVWRIQERLSWQEIAGRLDRSEDAARMLCKRAINRLLKERRGESQ